MNTRTRTTIGFTTCLAAAGVAYAAVTCDPQGYGFVGKGDVQTLYGWNNKQLQNNTGKVMFRLISHTETSVDHEWSCQHPTNEAPPLQERSNSLSTTTTVGGLVSSVERIHNQITGFLLEGFDENTISSTEVKRTGPPLWSCPNDWILISPSESEPVTTTLVSELQVSVNGGNSWELLPQTP
jgi:hypothetical protein